jgi:hypothetical protein
VLASEYEPPVIDLAATPIRVERRRVGGRLEHHVVGLVWGGAASPGRLAIRFGSRDPWTPFDLCPSPSSMATWRLWSYAWTPPEPGVYTIALRCPDPGVRTRRLDTFFYARRVRV